MDNLAASWADLALVCDRQAPPPLASFVAEIRGLYPPMARQRAPGPDAGVLAAHFGRRIIPDSAL